RTKLPSHGRNQPGPSLFGGGETPQTAEAVMKVRDLMTRDVRTVRPEQTIREAARMMAEMDAGSLPVADDQRLVGMLTDGDIAVRAVARGLGPDAPASDVMTHEVKYCFDDEELDH